MHLAVGPGWVPATEMWVVVCGPEVMLLVSCWGGEQLSGLSKASANTYIPLCKLLIREISLV